MPSITLLPLGCEDEWILNHIRETVSRAFPDLSCSIGPESKALLDGCLNPERQQHNASILLRNISGLTGSSSTDYPLGITEADLYVPEMNFVFGLADQSIRAGVISLHRLKPERLGGQPDPALYADRAVKEAIHELGHIFGLYHCRSPDCVMFFSNTLADTDQKGRGFCSSCRSELDQIRHP